MTQATSTIPETTDLTSDVSSSKSKSLWADAWDRLKQDRIAVICLGIVIFYSIIALLSATGLLAAGWSKEVGPSYAPPFENWDYILGTDIFGRCVLTKIIHGTQVAMSVGLISSLIAIPIGVALGALAGYFGGWVEF